MRRKLEKIRERHERWQHTPAATAAEALDDMRRSSTWSTGSTRRCSTGPDAPGAPGGRAMTKRREATTAVAEHDAVLGEYREAIAEIERFRTVLSEIGADPGSLGAVARAALQSEDGEP